MTQQPLKDPAKDATSLSHSRFYLFMFLAILFLILGFTAKMVAPYLLSIVMGGLFALLLMPVNKMLLKRNWAPSISAGLITLSAIVLVVGPLLLFLTRALQQGLVLVQHIGDSAPFSMNDLVKRALSWEPLALVFGNTDSIENQVQSVVRTVTSFSSSALINLASNLPLIFLQIALTLLATYFFLVDGRRFMRWTANKVPLEPDVRHTVYSTFRDTAVSSVWATLAAALAQSVVVALGFLGLGVPAVFLAGGATFLFAWIPLVGSTPVWGAACIYLLIRDQMGAAIAMLIIGLSAGLIDNLIRPAVLKGRSDMHPLVSLVSVFGGIQVFGLFGVFLGPVTVGVLIALLEIWPLVASRLGLDLNNGDEAP